MTTLFKHPQRKKYLVRSLGCKANMVDGQVLEKALQDQGWIAATSEDEASLCIVNSCTVTDEADRQSRKLASRLARKNPESIVAITGCSAEVDPERLTSTPGVHYIIGNSDKPKLVEILLAEIQSRESSESEKKSKVLGQVRGYDQLLSRHPMDREWPSAEAQFPNGFQLRDGNSVKTRSFLKIQDGCNSFCTYCIIPYGRGPSRSQSPAQIIQQIEGLIHLGCKEVILTGTNIGDYGADWGEDLPNGVKLAQLTRQILTETSLERLRLSSLDPTEISADLIQQVVEFNERLCPHFHVSLQSPHSRILRAMKRKYTFVEVERCLRQIHLKVPNAFVGMDVITGFPGESLHEFQDTVAKLDSLPWSRLHVFPYSERKGTPATRLAESVPPQERQRRTQVLLEMSRKRLRSYYENQIRLNKGVFDKVLMERLIQLKDPDPRPFWPGYTPNYLRLVLPATSSGKVYKNTLIRARAVRLIEDLQNQDFAIEVLEMTDN